MQTYFLGLSFSYFHDFPFDFPQVLLLMRGCSRSVFGFFVGGALRTAVHKEKLGWGFHIKHDSGY